MKVLWFLLGGLIIGHIFAAAAPYAAKATVETVVKKRYETSMEVTARVVPTAEEEPSQWAFLNNFVAVFFMAYGGLLLTYLDFGPEMKSFYRLMARIDPIYRECEFRDALFSLQLMPYGGSFLNGALVGYIARMVEVSFLKHVPLEVLGLLLAGLIGEKIEKGLRGKKKGSFKKRRAEIVKTLKYWRYFVASICLIAAGAAVEFL